MSGIAPLKSIKSGIGIRVGAKTVLRFWAVILFSSDRNVTLKLKPKD